MRRALPIVLFLFAVLLAFAPAGHAEAPELAPLRSALYARDLQRARSEVERLLPALRGDADFRRYHAELLRAEATEASSAVEADRLRREATELELAFAREALAGGAADEALRRLETLSAPLQREPAARLLRAEIQIARGDRLAQLQQIPDARRALEDARRLWPNHPDLERRLAELSRQPAPAARSRAALPPTTPAPVSAAPNTSDAAEGAPVQVFVLQNDEFLRRLAEATAGAPSAPASPGRSESESRISWIDATLLILLALANLQLFVLILRRKRT